MVSSLGSLASPIFCHGRQGGGVQVVWGSLPLTAPLTWGSPAPPPRWAAGFSGPSLGTLAFWDSSRFTYIELVNVPAQST